MKKILNISTPVFIAVVIIVILFAFTIASKVDNPDATTISSEVVQISPNYIEYSQEALSASLASGNALLFFAATRWCNTCSDLHEELIERSGEMPAGFTILQVDYDTDKETVRNYAVVMQHTLVHFASNGDEIERWVGGDLDSIIERINRL